MARTGRERSRGLQASRGRPATRLVSMLVVCVLTLALLCVRLVQLQVVQAQPLQTLGEEQRVRRIDLPAQRGTIFDRSMAPLAQSVDARAIYANPRMVPDPVVAAAQLAPVLGLAESDLVARLSKDAGFVYLARRVPVAIADRVRALDLPFVGAHPEPLRAYPAGSLAGQVLGFVGTDGSGLSGLEYEYEEFLGGRPGMQIIERDPRGRVIPQGRNDVRSPVAGRSLVLTIDRDVQFFAEDALARGVHTTGADNGIAVVMDPRSGDVLAMANYPPLDPERFGSASAFRQRNRAVTDAYEPGSVNKVITASAAIEKGLADPAEVLRVPATIRVGGKVFHDLHTHPVEKITYGEAIAQSSNIASIQVGLRLGPGGLYEALRRFGLGEPAHVGFPGESAGVLLPLKEWSGTSIATIPIGQGIAATPLQVASVYATIANDGIRVRPRIVRGIAGPSGDIIPVPTAKPVRVVRPYTAAQVRSMLVGVVEHGTGARARIPGYLVGGKTGTARVPLTGRRGYSTDIVTTFAGMAPADDPRLVVLVALDNPRPRYSALTATPVFREIMQFCLGKLHIPPTISVHDDAWVGSKRTR